MNKKGEMMWKLITLVLAIVILVVIVGAFFPSLFSSGDIIKTQIGGIDADPDCDDIKGAADECPCTSGDYVSVYRGCPAEFTLELKNADKHKYNTDTACGLINPCGKINSEEEEGGTFTRTPEEQALPHFRSLEIFAQDDDASKQGIVRQACLAWVGDTQANCPTEGNDCDDDEYAYQPLTVNCWIMASEQDAGLDQNDCGQKQFADGTIISESTYSNIDASAVQTSYHSVDGEDDPKILFTYKWKAPQESGSLLCNKGFWVGCGGGNAATIKVNGQDYECKNQEWTKK